VAGFYSATQPQNAAAPWPTIAPPRTAKALSLEPRNVGLLIDRGKILGR